MKTEKIIFIALSIIVLIASICSQHTLLNRYEYFIYGLLLVYSALTIIRRPIKSPGTYALWVVAFSVFCIINAIISQYVQSLTLAAIGLFITLIPFIHYLISYNFEFNDNDIVKFMNVIIWTVVSINTIAFIESFVIGISNKVYGILGSYLFWYQYVASINIQAIILSIACHKLTGNSQYKYIILFLACASILSVQLKTYMGLAIVALIYTLTYSRRHTAVKITGLFILGFMAFIALMQVPQIAAKVNHYNQIYLTDNDGIARAELYRASVEIASDHLPFGSGQGTFGSIPSNQFDSKVYYDYGLEYVWGLSKYDDVNFKMDTHWSSIIGENGFLGTIIYAIILLYPVIVMRKYRHKYKDYYFFMITCYTVLIAESITLNLVSRFAFIIIYAGLTGIITRRVTNNRLTQ